MAKQRFQGKTIIITGASAGVGQAAARAFAGEGANVVLAARSVGPIEALAEELGADRALPVRCDVQQRADLEGLLAKAQERFGAIHVLVNNAGYNARGAMEEVSAEKLETILETNLKAPMLLSKLAIPYLKAAGKGGAIVNVASLAGRAAFAHEVTYCASKFGLRGLTFGLRQELAEYGISVSCVSPGPIETGFILDEIDDVPDLVFSQPMLSAEEVAAAVVQCAYDGKRERAMPAQSGRLAQIVYLFPGLYAMLAPRLAKKGAKAKAQFLAKHRKPG